MNTDTDTISVQTYRETVDALQAKLDAALAENERLRASIAKHEAFARSVDCALNSGDGSYRP